MKKIVMAFGLIIVLSLAGCQQKGDMEVLTVLTSSGYEPYEMVDEDGQLTGFDIELMEALASEAGIEIEWLDVSFEGIIASLQAGQYEVAIAGITPTPDRANVVDFGEVYYNSENGITNYMVYEDENSYNTLDDLQGLVVGAQLGTIQAELLGELAEDYGFTVELRDTNSQIIEEIKIGTINVLLVESLVADSIVEANSEFTKTELITDLDQLYGNAIAFAKGSGYVDIFNNALEVLKDNGTLDYLIAKWFQE